MMVERRSSSFGGGSGRITDVDFIRYVGGNLTLNNTAWTRVPTLDDITLNASVGDMIEAGIGVLCNAEAVIANFDIATIAPVPDGPIVNQFGGTTFSGNWRCNASVIMAATGSIMYTLQAGDIYDDTVTLRLIYKTSSAANKTLLADGTSYAAQFWAKNLSQ